MKVIILRKGFIALAALVLVACLWLSASFGADIAKSVAGTKRDLPIYCADRKEKVASLTFDAAWGADDTETLIAILKKYNVRATFFLVGQWVEKYPKEVKALSDAGHEIMNHSNTHAHMTSLSREGMIADVQACGEKIKAITGKTPNLFRAPYGEYNDAVVSSMRAAGYYTIQWDVDSLDWKNLSAAEITKRVTTRVKPGSIVLFHNDAENTPEALPAIIEKLLADGYSLVPVSEIIYKENYTIDHTGKQIPSA